MSQHHHHHHQGLRERADEGQRGARLPVVRTELGLGSEDLFSSFIVQVSSLSFVVHRPTVLPGCEGRRAVR